jgi:pyridoxamine 5'-phosphate oxidase
MLSGTVRVVRRDERVPKVELADQGIVRDLLRGLAVFDTELPSFDPGSAPGEPVALFVDWLTEAIEAAVREPHAMTVSTADGDGRPSSRVLICKDVLPDGTWCFASSSGSRKGLELASTPFAALCFHWREQGRQIRVQGPTVPATPERSTADFLARPLASRAEALVGRQSEVLRDPGELADAIEHALTLLREDPAKVAPGWTLYGVRAEEVEFWQADRDRRHTRVRYSRGPGEEGWTRELLWP